MTVVLGARTVCCGQTRCVRDTRRYHGLPLTREPEIVHVARLASARGQRHIEAQRTLRSIEPPEGSPGVEGVPTGFDGEIRWRISASRCLIFCKR